MPTCLCCCCRREVAVAVAVRLQLIVMEQAPRQLMTQRLQLPLEGGVGAALQEAKQQQACGVLVPEAGAVANLQGESTVGTWSWAGLPGPRPEHLLGRQGPVCGASFLQTSRKAPAVQRGGPTAASGGGRLGRCTARASPAPWPRVSTAPLLPLCLWAQDGAVPKQVFSKPRALVTRHHLPLGRPGHPQVGKPPPGPQTAWGTGGTLPEERVWAGLG